MIDDERAQDVSRSEPEGDDTAQINAGPGPEPRAPGRWATVTEPAQRHPVGLAIGTAMVGLVVGLLGGLTIDAHPMMSLTVGTAPVPAVADHGGPGGLPFGPPGEAGGGPAFEGRQGPPPPPPPPPGPHLPGMGGPGGPMGPGGPPPSPGEGPRGPGIAGPGDAPRPGGRASAPPDGGQAPPESGGSQPAKPGGDAPQSPPLPAERGNAPQSSGT